MSLKSALAEYSFAPVADYPLTMPVLDLSEGFNPEAIKKYKWAIGRYNEYRPGMYTAGQYKGERNIHIGIDIWGAAGKPLYLFYEGTVAYKRDNNQPGNYGPTIITRHNFKAYELYVLWGHLSRSSLDNVGIGQALHTSETIAFIGQDKENGGWPPHLHIQLSRKDPGEADMPGVVSREHRKKALHTYPDPRWVLGDLY